MATPIIGPGRSNPIPTDPYATQSPEWWNKEMSPKYYWNPESTEMSYMAFPDYLPVYMDPAYTGSLDPADIGTADYLYSPQYTMGMTDISNQFTADRRYRSW
jgi:hypothetical protein